MAYFFYALDPKWMPQNNLNLMWKDDGRSRPLIPKGEPSIVRIRPHRGHVLIGHYKDKEVTTQDAHDANKKNGICGNIRKHIENWERCYLENETYHENMEEYVTCWKDVVEELDNPFPRMPCKLQLGFWPPTTHVTTNTSMFNAFQEDMTPKDDSKDPSCGIACDNPKQSYNP